MLFFQYQGQFHNVLYVKDPMNDAFSESLEQTLSNESHKVVTWFKMSTKYYKWKHQFLWPTPNVLIDEILLIFALLFPKPEQLLTRTKAEKKFLQVF